MASLLLLLAGAGLVSGTGNQLLALAGEANFKAELYQRKAALLEELVGIERKLGVRGDEPPPGGSGGHFGGGDGNSGGHFGGGGGNSGGHFGGGGGNSGGHFGGAGDNGGSGEQIVYVPYSGEHFVVVDEGMQTGRFDGDIEACATQCSNTFHTDGHCNSFAWCYPGAAAGYPGGATDGSPFCYLKDKKMGPNEAVRRDTWCTTYVPQSDAMPAPPINGYKPFQGTHRVLVHEGQQVGRFDGDLGVCADECKMMSEQNGHCKSFAWCEPGAAPGFEGGDTSGRPFCYLKDKTPAVGEPTTYSSWCTTYVPA